ncbi:LOW QUALITY PROTEIN: hypothetical protein ACHAW6_005593 [Cyclotella cf. meneghiniana]
MSRKSQAPDTLGGSPTQDDCGRCKGDEIGRVARKCKEATCYPWSNSTEHEIREFKKGAARKLTRSDAPRQLWCFVLEYESYVHSHTAHDIYQLDGRVPNWLSRTADISLFCEFGCWDWFKFREDGVAFPDDQMVLVKYLGPSIDVGPAMMQCVMKVNGEYEDRSTAQLCSRIRRHF